LTLSGGGVLAGAWALAAAVASTHAVNAKDRTQII
jgi:hypothetical protein